ncbi:hypothetical protein Goshw_008225, partial [Gossypium schwendimanii]|nr:hypothetical protein [Gossypium schwendimanii]
ADDRVLNGFIHNLSKNPDTEIHGYLQDVGFLHVSRMLEGCKLSPTLINALVERWRPETHFPSSMQWNYEQSYVVLSEQLGDIRLLLDQHSKAKFLWMPYADSNIIECVSFDMWNVKVPLIMYATMKMHESDQVMQKFKWRQKISPPPLDMKALHKLDLQGKIDEN